MDEQLYAALVAAKTIFFDESWISNLQSQKTFLGTENTELNAGVVGCVGTFCLKEKKMRIPDFVEKWLTSYTDNDFFNHFRMTRTTFNFIMKQIGALKLIQKPIGCGPNEPVELEKALLVLVWYLAKGETLLSIADRFNIGISTTHGVIDTYLGLMISLKSKFITWPTRQEAAEISQKFDEISGYPEVIGAIDGTHFTCIVPKDQHDSYQNRKMQHSVIMQAIADSNRVLRDIFVGFPGSANDGRVLRESPLMNKVEKEGPQCLFYNNYHLVGDKAYICYEWLMTPYRDTGRMTRLQKHHNYTLSKARVIIENVFGLLKGRWRILRFINVYSIKKVVDIVVACSVLHNMCLFNNDVHDEVFEEDARDWDDDENPVRGNARGIQKRDEIANNLS